MSDPIPQQPLSTPPPPLTPGSSAENDKLWAALSYFFTPIVPAIVLLSETNKARPFQKYHALQALGVFGAEVVLSIAVCIVYTVLTAVSFGILGLCLWILFFVPVIPAIYYAYVVYTRPSYFEIPTVTQFMVQQGWLTRPVA